MDELENMFQSGMIDFKTYEDLRKKLDPTYKQEYERAKESVAAAQEFVQQEKSRGLGSVNIGGDVDKNIYMTPDELETYTSRGIEPTYGVDYENIRAERQTWQDQLANGVTKFVGKTATGVAGGLGMIPTIAVVGLGQLTDMLSPNDNWQFKDIYDNDYQRLMDSANEAMDSALPNYVSNAQREASVWNSMGTMNFWANDLLGGASFVASALLTEYLTAGMASGLAVGRAGKYLKELSTASKLEDVVTQASKFSGGIFPPGLQMNRAAKLARQVATGAGYEAAVEARHFVDQAKEQYINDYIEQYGHEPTEEQIAVAMDDIHSVGNGVFGTNLALVSLGNMITLPKTFAPGLASKFGFKAGKVTDADWVVRPSELTDTQLARMAKKTGKSIDELKATDFVNKWDGLSKVERLARAGKGRFAPMVTEGFFEEGLQGVTQNAALDYISNRLNPDNINEVADLSESVIRGFEEQYDVSKAEGWKEIIIGSILGGVGAPNIGRAKGQPMWQGGVFGYQSPGKRENIQSLIGDAIKYGKATTENIKHAATVAGATKRQDDAIAQGDMFEAKNQEYASMYSYVSTMVKLGRFDEIDSEVSKMVEKMSADEFGEQFGYTNLTEEELGKRKTEVLSTFRQRANDIREARELAEKVSIYEDDEDLKDGLGYVFGISKNIDARENQMFKLLQEKLGKIYSTDEVKQMAAYVNFQRTTDGKDLKEYGDKAREKNQKVAELEKLTREELTQNKNRTSKSIMERGKKLDALTNEIAVLENTINSIEERLNRQYTEYLKANGILTEGGEFIEYTRDKQAFKQDFELFKRVQKDVVDAVGEDFYDRPDIKPVFDDLMKLATYRQQQITLANYYMTKKGQTKLANEIDNLKKMAADELVSDELDKTTQVFQEKQRQLDNMQRVAAEAYKANAQRTFGIAFAKRNIQKAGVALKEALTDVQDVDLKKLIEDQCEKLNIALGVFRSDVGPDQKQAYAEQGLQEIENIKKFFDIIKSSLTPEQVAEVDKFLKGDYLKQVAEEFNSFLKDYKKDTNNTSLSSVPRIFGPNKLVSMIQDYIESDGKKALMQNSADAIANKAELRIVEYPEGGKLVDLETVFNQTFDDKVKLQKGLVGDGVEQFGIQVVFDGVWIGNILDPNRFRFKDENGNYVDFNESVEHLELLNPEFVKLDTDGKKIPSDDGKFFIDHYRSTMLSFNEIKEEIRNGKREFSNADVQRLFNIKQLFGKIEDVRNDNQLPDWSHLDDGTLLTDLSLFGGTGKGLLVQSKLANVLDYYIYNPTSKTLEQIPLEVKEKITKYWESRQYALNKFSGAYKIIYETDGAPRGIRLNPPEVQATENVINFVNDNLTRLNEEVLENIAKSKADGTNLAGVPGWDTKENFFLVSDAVGKNIYIKTTGTPENSTNPIKGSSLVLALDMGAGKDLTVELISTDESRNTFKSKTGKTINKRNFGWSFVKDTSGNLIITYKNKAIKDNFDLIKAVNTYLKDTLPDAIKEVNNAGGIANVKNDAYKLAYNFAVTNDKGEMVLPNITRINKNFPKEEFVDNINSFTPAVNPTITYLFQGKNQVWQNTDFQTLMNNWGTQYNKAKNSETLLRQLKSELDKAYNALDSSNKKYKESNYKTASEQIEKRIEEIKTGTITSTQQAPPPQPPQPPQPPTSSNANNSAINNYGKKNQPPQPPQPPPGSSNPFFARKDAQETRPIDIDEVTKRLANILPPEIGVKAIEELVTGLANNAFTYGLFRNAVIYLGKDVPKGVEYHEAFHAVFRMLLTPAQQAKVISEAKDRYNKPTSEQLDELRSLSDEYTNLSLKELTNLYYEEKLADDFMDLMNGTRKTPKEKSFLEKIFDLLKRIVNFFKKGNPDDVANIDALFNSIRNGAFKNAKVVNAPTNNLSLFSALKFPAATENNNIVERFHQSRTGANIISQVSALSRDRMRDVGVVYDTDIRNMIQQVVDNNISILVDVINNEFQNDQYATNPSLQEAHQNELLNVIRSLYKDLENDSVFWNSPGGAQFEPTIEKNIKDIISEVRKHIDTIKFDDYDVNGEEMEDNTTTDLAQKPNQRVGGIESTSKEMKKYIMETEMPLDIYNLGLSKEILENDPRFRNYVNGIKLYNSIERMLVNTEREDLLKKLHYIKEGQPMLSAFYERLVKDICLELNIKYYNGIGSDIINQDQFPIEMLAKSDKFCLFVASFTKHKSESIVNIFDQETGQSKTFISNVNDSRKIQREIWYNNWKRLNLDNKKEEVSKILTSLNLTFDAFNSKDAAVKQDNIQYIFNNFNEKVSFIKEQFGLLGISLSDKYIQLSLYKLLKENRDMSDVLNQTGDSQFKSLDKILESYNDVEFINAEITKGLINSTVNEGSPFTNKSEIQKLNTDAVQIDDSVEDALGAKGRLNDLASGNSMFDESVSASTIRNVEGEMVYIHLYPNYITSLFLKLRNNPNKLFNAVDASTFEEGVKLFKDFLIDNKLYVIDLLNDQQIEYFFRTLYFNPILKASNSEIRESQLQNILPFTLDGLKQQAISETGQIESYKGSKASAYAALDKRGKFLMMLNLFAKTEMSLVKEVKVGDKTYEKYPLIAFQNEGKDTQWAFTMFKRKFLDNKNNLSDLGKEFLTSYLKGELSSIQAVYRDLLNDDGSIEGFNILKGAKVDGKNLTKEETLDILKDTNNPNFMKVVSQFRGLNLVEFQFLKGLPIYNDIIKAAVTNESDSLDFNSIVEVAFKNAYQNFIKELSSSETAIIKPTADNKYESQILPAFYKDGNRNLDETKMKEFFINNWINAATVNNLIFGNLSVGLKDAVDLTKRYAGPNAAGPSLGFGDVTFAILNDELFDYVNPSNGKLKTGEERTNAQSYGTIEWYYNNYLKTFAKSNPEIDKIYRKIRMMKEISARERGILEEYGALMNPRKTSMFNAFVYGKTSTDVITRSEVSYVDKKDIPAFEKAIDELLKITDPLEYHKKQMEIQDFYKPIPSAIKRHELLNKMERQQVDVTFFKSAIKTTKKNVTNWDDELIPMKINSEFFREQVVTDNMKEEIIHGTQLMQLIYSEHDDGYEVNIGNRKHTVGTLRKLYRKLLGDRLFESYGNMRKAIFDKNGNPDHKAMLKSFRQSILEQGGDPTLLELFDGVGSKPNYNLNLPRLLSMYESMFLAFVGKGTFSQKVSGHKFTLASDFGEDVMTDGKGKVITRREFLKDPEAYKNVNTRRLELKQGEDGVWYAECKISMQTAQMMNISEGQYLSEEFCEMLGIRIPTQDKHSMVKLKVVDVFPAEKGNKLVMPYELLIMSGADFDIDSEFVRTVDYYTNTDAQGNEHINVFGSYLKNKDPEKRLKYAFYDFYEEKINSKEIKPLLSDLKETDTNYLDNKKAIEDITVTINNIKNDLSVQRKISRKSEQALDNIIDDSTADVYTEILKNAKELQDSHKKTLLDLIAAKKTLLLEKKKIIKDLEKRALSIKGYPTTAEEFKNYRIKGQKTAGDIVESNYNNYSSDQGSISNIEPITIGEINNVLLDIEKALVNYGDKNTGNNKRATTPASRDAAEEFIKKYYESGDFIDPVNVSEYSTPTATVTMSHANAIGKQNIGIAAIGNIVFQYLKNANVEIENLGIRLDSYTNEDSQRINDLISTIISMAVDNAKFQDAIRFNITPQTQGAFIFMVMAKKPFEYVSLIHLQESVLAFAADAAAKQSPIQNKKEKSENEDGSIQSILQSYKTKANLSENEKEVGDITDELLIKAKKFSELLKNGTTVEDAVTLTGMKEDLFNYVNYKALNEFLTYSDISRQSTGFSGFVSLIKGLSTELAETENIINKLENIGLQIVQKNNGQSYDDYVLEYTPEYIDYVNNVRMNGLPNEKYPIDYKQVIDSDPFLTNQIKAFAMFLNDSSKFFVSRTPGAKRLFKKIQAVTKPYYFNNVSNLNKLIKLVNAFYADKALKHKYPVLKGDLNSIAVESKSDFPMLIKLLIDFKNGDLYPELASNKFIQMLDFKKISYTDSSKAGFKNRDIYYVISNSFIRLSPEEQASVTADFELLMQPNLFTSDQLVANQITEFRQLLIGQMLNKDLGMYRNESYISFLPPSLFKVISDSLNDSMKALQGTNKDFKDTFGITEEELNKEFVEYFARHIDNTFNLKSQNSVIVFSQIKSAFKNFIDNMNPEEKAYFDNSKSEIAQEILSYANELKINPDKESVEKLFDSLFAEDSKIREILPLKYERATDTTKAKLYVSIFPKSKEIDKKDLMELYRSPLTKLNKEALLSTRLFSMEYVKTKDGIYSNMIYPEFIVFNFKSDNKSNYKVLKRINIVRGNTVSNNPDAGISAEYEEVSRIANKNVLPYAFPINQLEAAAEGLLTEEPDMTFGLTPDSFEDYSVKPLDKKAIIDKLKELAATKKQTGFTTAQDTFDPSKEIKIPIFEPVTITLNTVKAIKNFLRPLNLNEEFNDLVFKLDIEDVKLGLYELKVKGEKKEFILAKIINIIENYKSSTSPITSTQPSLTPASFESIEKSFYDLNKSYFENIGLSFDMYSKNNKNTKLASLDDLVNAYKGGMDIEDYKPILPATTQQLPTQISTSLDYKKMSKIELAAIFNSVKSKIANNPKYNITTFYDFQAYVLKYDNNIIQEMINECI